MILAEGSEKLRTLMNDAKQESSNNSENQPTLVIYLDEDDFEIVREVIEFLYTGCCVSLPAVPKEDVDEELPENEQSHQFNQLAFNIQDVDFGLLDSGKLLTLCGSRLLWYLQVSVLILVNENVFF